jgi:hypothetical protein
MLITEITLYKMLMLNKTNFSHTFYEVICLILIKWTLKRTDYGYTRNH